MEIGSEISEKIQLAIKAKLVEINAYVDDELPDYIMIMIANRKPEEQMSDALSLFLGNNAKSFTKWLYELLGSLRKKTGDKPDPQSTSNKTELKQKIADDTIEKATVKESSPVQKPESLSKISRWDVKKPIKRKSLTTTAETSVKDDVDNKRSSISKEAVIDILPEIDDLFDAELMGDTKDSAIKNSQKTTSKSKLIEITSKSGIKPISCDSSKSKTVEITKKSGIKPILFNKDDQKSSSTSGRKLTTTKSSEKKQKPDNEITKSSRPLTSTTSEKSQSNKKDTGASLQKRTVAVKSFKDSSKKVSTTDKEFSNQFAPPKSKKKKLKRSRSEKESSSKERHASSQKPVREWDRAKGREPLTYDDDPPSRRPSRSDQVEKVSVKSRISQVSSTLPVAKDPQYESEDSDASPVRSSVISKVAVPQRRSRLPPSKQANRSLLLRAVSEAESSIKQFLENKSIEPVSEEAFKSRVEKHKRTAFGNVLERNRIQDQDGSRKQVTSRLLRDTKLLRPTSEDAKKDKILIKKVPQKRKSEVDIATDKTDKALSLNAPQFGDSRRIVSRDQDESVKSRKLLRRSAAVENIAVSRDSRKLSVQDSSIDDEAVIEKENDGDHKSKQNSVDVSELEQQPKKQRRRRSSSPCFIVTLDGSSSTKKEERPPSKKEHSSSERADKLRSSEKKSDSVSIDRTKPAGVARQISATVNEKSKTLADEDAISERELENMREKLLAMQEKAKKLKEIQSKRQEMLQQKLDNGQTATKSSDKLIHIANVHFSATENQLSDHFSICGKVVKVTILKDSFTGHSKG